MASLLTYALGLALALASAIAVASNDDAFAKEEVKDLAYGEALYFFYQNKYFSAITHLLAAQKTNRLTHHQDSAELLRGGLYLSYGLYSDAEQVFERLIKSAPPDVAARAWFHLAQVHYRLGHYAAAENALDKIKGPLLGEWEPRRKLLTANLYIAQQNYPAAITALTALTGKSIWHHYARYNLGIAYLKNRQFQEGEQLLTEIGKLPNKEREVLALRDKANLALGYMHLKEQRPQQAISYFENVRLQGQFSNPALFGMGQAYAELAQFEDSLKYWTTLRERTTHGAAVFESLLAVPTALAQLGAHKQALDGYQYANTVFKADIERIDAAITGLSSQRLLEELLQASIKNNKRDLPGVFKHHYLTEFIAGHEFNEALKNYQDVHFLQQHLADKIESLNMLEQILQARTEGFNERLPKTIAQASPLLHGDVQDRFNRLAGKLGDTERTRDILQLATEEEQALLQRINAIEKKIQGLPETERDAIEGKYRLLRGVLLWRLDAAYLSRLQNSKESLVTLQQAIAKTAQLYQALDKAKHDNPQTATLYHQQIATNRIQVIGLQQRATLVADQHEAYIQRLATVRLAQQKQRLVGYIHQANFSIAQIYDIAATTDKKTRDK